MKLIAVIISILCFSLAIQASAQKKPDPLLHPADYVTAQNEIVRVFVHKATGQFWVELLNGTKLLFAGADGGTSASSVFFNGTTFTNNDLRAPQPPPNTVSMPPGTATVLGDSIVFETVLSVKGKELTFRQVFFPMLESDYGFVRIKSILVNNSTVAVLAGCQNLFDLFLATTDLVTVTVDSNQVGAERSWRPPDMPDGWSGTASILPAKIRGRIQGGGTVSPDVFTVGNWRYNGYLGAPYWDYIASGLPVTTDNAILLQWNERSLLVSPK